MPESRLAKTRASLPEGYQFGDARPTCEVVCRDPAYAALFFAILEDVQRQHGIPDATGSVN